MGYDEGMDAVEVLACSGPGAVQAISASETYATTLIVVAGSVALITAIYSWLTSSGFLGSLFLLAMLAVHPRLWVSAMNGDCGEALRESSTIWTIAIAVVSSVIIGRSIRAGRSKKASKTVQAE